MPDNAEYMEQLLNKTLPPSPMVAGLREIQELHGRDTYGDCLHCNESDGWATKFPCATRQLADKALGETNG